MEKRTYGAPRLVDWVAQIKAGAATLRVHFTGGALTSYGVTPAEYSTSDPFIQTVIEQSSYFKEGRIILVRRTQVQDGPMSAKTVRAHRAPKSKASDAVAEVDVAPQKVEEKVETIVTTAPQTTETDSGEAEEIVEEVEDMSNGIALTEVATSCLQDAQAYLQEHHGISSYKVRSYEAAQRAGSEHGVKFIGAKFDTLDKNNGAEDASAENEE